MANTKPIVYQVNPECAAQLTRTATILDQVVKELEHVSKTIYGNGKTGLVDLARADREDIIDLQIALNKMIESHTKTEERVEAEKKEKRGDMRKFWLQAALSVIVSVVAIAQVITIFLLTGK